MDNLLIPFADGSDYREYLKARHIEVKIYKDLLLNWSLCKRMGLDEVIQIAEDLIEDIEKN